MKKIFSNIFSKAPTPQNFKKVSLVVNYNACELGTYLTSKLAKVQPVVAVSHAPIET